MNTARKMNVKEVVEIIQENPFWSVENPPIVIKSYRDGRKKMFVKIKEKGYYIMQNKKGIEEWYEVINGSKTRG